MTRKYKHETRKYNVETHWEHVSVFTFTRVRKKKLSYNYKQWT